MEPGEDGPVEPNGPPGEHHENKPGRFPALDALNRRGALLGLAAVGGIAAIDGAAFAYAGGYLRPGSPLTPNRFADGFESVYGRHDGFRRNHAKGLSVTGTFVSNGAAAALCRAALFRAGSVPVIGRFSLGGGLPDQADKPDTVRGLGLLLQTPDGQQWRTAMINMPVFPDRTPQGFYERMLAYRPLPETGKADPTKVADFLGGHPETAAALKVVKQWSPAAGFADSTFNSLNAFHFTNSAGATIPVRWSAVPRMAPTAPVAPQPAKDYLFDDLIRAVSKQPVRWRLLITVGEPGDPTDDATKPWPQSRRTVDAGTITINKVQTEEAGNARDVNFDPTVLPDGITTSDDPLLAARSAVYARSFTRRAEEPKSPSEVDVAKVLS